MTLVWGVPPPKRLCAAEIGMLCVEPGEVVLCRLLGPPTGLWTHWVNKRTVACLGAAECPVHHEPQTWKGFAPVESWGRNWRGRAPGKHISVLVITQEIGETVAGFSVGDTFEISRRSSKRNSPLQVALKEPRNGKDVSPAFDVKPYVLRAMSIPQNASRALRQSS